MWVAGIDAGVGLANGRVGLANGRVGVIARGGVDRIIVIVAATGDDGGGERKNRDKGEGKEN